MRTRRKWIPEPKTARKAPVSISDSPRSLGCYGKGNAISRIPCPTCKADTIHQGLVCFHCKTVHVLTQHNDADYNYKFAHKFPAEDLE
jgi:hypothetical protein